MRTGQITSADLSNDVLQGYTGRRLTQRAPASWFRMEGQVVVYSTHEQEFGRTWNQWMDTVGAERGNAEDLLDL